MDDILKDLGLAEMADLFKTNAITPEVVTKMSDAEFAALGVAAIGDRVRLRERCREAITGNFDTPPPYSSVTPSYGYRQQNQPLLGQQYHYPGQRVVYGQPQTGTSVAVAYPARSAVNRGDLASAQGYARCASSRTTVSIVIGILMLVVVVGVLSYCLTQ